MQRGNDNRKTKEARRGEVNEILCMRNSLSGVNDFATQ